MPSRLTDVIFDCHDLDVVADFWCAALGYERSASGEGWQAIAAPATEVSYDSLREGPPAPALAFVVVPEARSGKNRVHVDITPFEGTQQEEVERLSAIGARPVDIGQRDRPWVVMADPEGNEFCVMPGPDDRGPEGGTEEPEPAL